MEFRFNKIKDLMQEDNNQPLPPELDWNNMKDGIFGKMQSIQQEEASRGVNNYSGRRLGLILLLFFALTIGPFSIAHHMMKNQDAEEIVAVQLPEKAIYKGASNKIDKAAPINQIGRSVQPLVENNQKANANDHLLTYKRSKPNQDTKDLGRSHMDGDQSLEYRYLTKNDLQNNQINTDRLASPESALNAEQNALMPSVEPALSNSMPRIPNLRPLPTCSFDQIALEKTNISIPGIQKLDSVYLSSIHRRKSPNLLILEGGVTFWAEGYGKIMPERAQYETPLTSFLLQGYYMKSFGRNYFLMAGLQYQQLESRFQYNTTIQDYKITIKDTIIQVQNNLLTGQQNIIYGDVETSVQAEHRIIHHNTTRLFKVTTAIGKTWQFNSFQTDVYLGGALNTLVHNQGRTLDQDIILDYYGPSNSLFQNQLAVDATFGIRLHYFLNPNIGLTMGLQTQKSLTNWSKQADINFYPVSYGVQLGLSYSLN